MNDPREPVGTPYRRSGSFLRASLVMIVLSLALFWLPVAGPLVAGFVGGRIAVSVGKAVAAALVPAVALGALVAGVLLAFDLPVIGSIAGFGVFLVVLVQDLPLFAGAVMGAGLEPG